MDKQELANSIIRRQEALASDRATWEGLWREIDERVSPQPDLFGGSKPVPGTQRTEKMFDATASLALDRFAAAMESMLTPRTQRWHSLGPSAPALKEVQQVKEWCDQVTDLLFSVRYNPKANFASQTNEVYRSLGKFGTGALFIDDVLGQGIRYKSIHLSEIYVAENAAGIVDTVHRKFEYTARQAIQAFGEDKVPECIRTAMKQNQPDKKFEFIHCVKPNEDYDAKRKDYRGMAHSSYYVCLTSKQIVSEGGYRTFPYAVSRYITNPRETYGRSPAMGVLPDIKMVNEMSKTIIRAAHRVVDPPLLLQEDGVLNAFSTAPGALNYGGVDSQGNPVVHPLQTGARVDIGEEMLEQRRRLINDAYLVTLFQILVDTPNMTATEAMMRSQEKGALLAPTMGRQQSEMLGPMIERELDILSAAGLLPPLPDALREYGAEVDITYIGPLNRAQRAEEGVAIMRTLEAIGPLAQFDPSVLKLFKPEQIARELAEINGVPAAILRSPEEVEAMKQAEAQQAQLQQILAAAEPIANTAKTMAETQQIATQAGPGGAPVMPGG